MPQRVTERGFAVYAEFEHSDYESTAPESYTVQESSLATERKVWVGGGTCRAHLNEAEARMVRDALNEFLAEPDQPPPFSREGWKALREYCRITPTDETGY